MNRLLWTLTSFALAAAAAFAVVIAVGGQASREVEQTDAVDRRVWRYSWPQSRAFRGLPERFDLSALVTLSDRPDCSARFVVNAAVDAELPAHGVYVDVHGGGFTVGRIEGGIAVPRGTRSVPLAPGRQYEITLKRRGADLAVTTDGALSLLSRDHTFTAGSTALGVMGGARVSLKPLRRLADLPEFGDDFMRAPDDPSPWTVHSGTWKNRSLSTPSMSANAFSYHAKPDANDFSPAFATAGSASWDQYAVHSSVRPGEGGAVGLAVAVAGPSRYALFRWTARSDDEAGEREIVLVSTAADGARTEKVVAHGEGGYTPDQWYRLSATSSFGALSLVVDGHEFLRARCAEVSSGGIGLWSSSPGGATFDDVLVTPLYATDEPALGNASSGAASSEADWPSRWDAVGGTWSVRDAVMAAAGPRAADGKLLSSSGEWVDFGAQARVASQPTGRAGLVTNYRDETDHVLLTTDFASRRVLLERIRAGLRSTLDEAPLPSAPQLDLRLDSERGHLAGSVNGRALVEAWDCSASRGRVGVFVGRRSKASFSAFRAEALPHRRQIPLQNPVFESDKLMSGWAQESADWYRSNDAPSGTDIYWHTAPFHGDVELALDLPELDLPEGTIVLGIAKSPNRPNNGYGWKLRAHGVEDASGPAHSWHLSLTREGAVVGEVALESGHRVDSLFVRKRGAGICAGVNGEILAQFVDDDPLPGGRVAFLAGKIDVGPANARLYGGQVLDYRFNEAPSDWRVAAGTWQVTNRWQCDRRWSFFSGLRVKDAEDKSIVIWNKRRFPGDVVVDLFIMAKMEPERGKRYEYARDFNMTIAADGKDLTSGYSFVFGGFKNSRSGIYKGTTPLAETSELGARIPASMIIHQRWYHVRIKRSGNTLKYRVNFNGRNIVSLEAEDEAPPGGDRIAIWSHDCSIMVARMRVATGSPGGSVTVMESPDAAPRARAATLYDEDEKPEGEDE